MKDLSACSRKEQDDFFNSVDHVLCDVDGVLWHLGDPIPGALNAMKFLKRNKKVIYVSNNTTKTQSVYYNQLKCAGFDLSQDDLVRPPLAMINYLKKINFSKTIYLIGTTALRSELEDSGFKFEIFNYQNPEELVSLYVTQTVQENKDVGAVIADLDLNMTIAHLQKAATYLRNPEVLFLSGGSNKTVFFGENKIMIGPGFFQGILEDMAGRKPTCLAKPGSLMADFIKEKFNIKDPSKVLFVGDSIVEDMGFATNAGFKKLLVLSGKSKTGDVEKWNYPEEYKPDHYAESLQVVADILSEN